MKIRIGIVGYGNLGKAVEEELLKNSRFKLVAIFSRRTVISKFETPIEPYQNFKLFNNKIDVMLLCGGSLQDLEPQTEQITEYFDCINSFDNHLKISNHLETINQIATKSRHHAIVSCGWDPGLFSNMRALFYKILSAEPHTFWGKGISMGHSDAIRQIEGVDDGVQFTIPNKEAIKLVKHNKFDTQIPKHFRECFVFTTNGNKSEIENNIKLLPNYFKGQPTTVEFVSQDRLLKLKSKIFHSGEVVGVGTALNSSKFVLNFKAKMSSNPIFTAKIMVAYIDAILKLKQTKSYGAFTVLDIPISYLFPDQKQLINKFC